MRNICERSRQRISGKHDALGWRDTVYGEKQAVRLSTVRFRPQDPSSTYLHTRQHLATKCNVKSRCTRNREQKEREGKKEEGERNDSGKRYVNSLMDQTLFEECLGSPVSLRLIDAFLRSTGSLAYRNYSCQQRANRRCLHSREITSVICETVKYRESFTQRRLQKLLEIILRQKD